MTDDLTTFDLADPQVRSVAVAAMTGAIALGGSVCADRARTLAGRAYDDALHALTAGLPPTPPS